MTPGLFNFTLFSANRWRGLSVPLRSLALIATLLTFTACPKNHSISLSNTPNEVGGTLHVSGSGFTGRSKVSVSASNTLDIQPLSRSDPLRRTVEDRLAWISLLVGSLTWNPAWLCAGSYVESDRHHHGNRQCQQFTHICHYRPDKLRNGMVAVASLGR